MGAIGSLANRGSRKSSTMPRTSSSLSRPSPGHPHDLDHRPVAIGRHTEPRADAVGDVGRGEAFASDLLGEEVLGDELLQVATDLVLALGDDRGVRDR
jgi:hypothetical protein